MDRALDRSVVSRHAARLYQPDVEHFAARQQGHAVDRLGVAGHARAAARRGCGSADLMRRCTASAARCLRGGGLGLGALARLLFGARLGGLRELLLLLEDRRAPRFGLFLQAALVLAPRLLAGASLPPCACLLLAFELLLAQLLLALALLPAPCAPPPSCARSLFLLALALSLRACSSAFFCSCSLRCFSFSSISRALGCARRRGFGTGAGFGGGAGLGGSGWRPQALERAAAAEVPARAAQSALACGGGISCHSSATSGSGGRCCQLMPNTSSATKSDMDRRRPGRRR